jgi:hypothetical protein
MAKGAEVSTEKLIKDSGEPSRLRTRDHGKKHK